MKDLTKNLCEAEEALVSKPLLATSAERILILNEIKSDFNSLPQPLAFSGMLSALLDRVSTPVEDYDLIGGRCVDRELSEDEEAIFQSFINHPDNPERNILLGSGHCTYSWDTVVRLGLCGMRSEALEGLKSTTDKDKKIFFSAMIEIYDAIERYMLRYADAAEAIGNTELAKNMRLAATERPDSFAAALQLLWVITLIDCAYVTENPTLTVGRLDVILYPLYKADIESGRLTKDGTRAYITDYYCKHNLIMGRGEHQVGDESNSTTFKRICNFDAPQYLLLAGTDENGKPCANELTQLFAECIVPSFKNPVIVVRYVRDMDKTEPLLWKTLIDKAIASSSMMFYNDGNILATLKRMGFPREDAHKYAHFGCNWFSTGDNGAWMAGGPHSDKYGAFLSDDEQRSLKVPYMRANSEHSWPEDLVDILRTFAASEREDITIDDIYDAFFDRMASFIDRKLDYLSRELKVRQRRPSAVMTFGDCFFTDSIKTGECFSASAKYHFEIQSFQMFGTVVDSFIAIDKLVMNEKKATLSELVEALDSNFKSNPRLLALCRNADKYGMDTPLSSYHVKRLSKTATDLVMKKNAPYFASLRLFLLPCMQSDTWHLKMGEGFGATPDGRLAHTAFSQNTRPSNGVCVNGLTAMFNSMLDLPHDGLLSGALNLDVDTKQFEGEVGKAQFASMLAVYFNRGGLHAQVTCVGLDALLDAQNNPTEHKDLRVRVTGYSGVFVDICKRLQDDIIKRLK
jgi:formate C-acetyltransferase